MVSRYAGTDEVNVGPRTAKTTAGKVETGPGMVKAGPGKVKIKSQTKAATSERKMRKAAAAMDQETEKLTT